MSAPIYGPFASGAGASIGQDPYIDYLGPMMSGTNGGVNSSVVGGTSCQVYANSSGLVVLMRPGSCLIRGVMFHSDVDTSITVAANPSGSTRTDLVVMRLDRTAGTLLPHIITGTPGAAAPSPVQAVGGVWDSPLAQVVVTAGSTGITPGQVFDVREYLNLTIRFCDSRNGYPPADGTQGRVFYDNNPSVMDLIVTDGSTWRTVRQPKNDSGWQTIGVPYFATSLSMQYRIIGNRIDWRGIIFKVSGEEDPDIGVISANLFPPGYGSFLSPFFPVVTFDPSGNLEGGWAVRLINEGPTDMRLRIVGPPLPLFGRVWSINFSYLLD